MKINIDINIDKNLGLGCLSFLYDKFQYFGGQFSGLLCRVEQKVRLLYSYLIVYWQVYYIEISKKVRFIGYSLIKVIGLVNFRK